MRRFASLAEMRLLVNPNGQSAAWVHPLDLKTGHFPQYAEWTDCTEMDDEELEALVIARQKGV